GPGARPLSAISFHLRHLGLGLGPGWVLTSRGICCTVPQIILVSATARRADAYISAPRFRGTGFMEYSNTSTAAKDLTRLRCVAVGIEAAACSSPMNKAMTLIKGR